MCTAKKVSLDAVVANYGAAQTVWLNDGRAHTPACHPLLCCCSGRPGCPCGQFQQPGPDRLAQPVFHFPAAGAEAVKCGSRHTGSVWITCSARSV